MKRWAFLALALAAAACSPSTPQTGSQTNWLIMCTSSQDCDAGVECLCGACTRLCASDSACDDLPDASCVASHDHGSIALCGGQAPPSGVCLPRCDDASCAAGTSCVAGVCVPELESAATVTLDTSARHQTLVGFGASLAYADDGIVAHAQKDALYDLLFVDAGLDVLRLRNRHQDGGADSLQPAREIVEAASERIGRTPFLFMTSGTPPEALKANGSRTCSGDPATCTLVSLPGGGFDYAGFASYWRSSLEAYADVGITPDYLSIQNNPNWVPPADVALDACYFLPEEGTTTVTVDGTSTDVAYPGYREALAQVRDAIADLPSVPRLGIPETGFVGVGDFVPALETSAFDALAVHFYGVQPAAVDVAELEDLRALAEQLDRPVFQTEVQAEGFDTATLIHHALVNAGASVYLQNDLVSLTSDLAPWALVLLNADDFEAQGPYFALAHYAKATDPGWVRIDAVSDSSALLSSAWLSPDESALTIVLVNPDSEELAVEVALADTLRSRLVRSEVTRTVFDGLERAAVLGQLPASGVVRIPGRSITTVALAGD